MAATSLIHLSLAPIVPNPLYLPCCPFTYSGVLCTCPAVLCASPFCLLYMPCCPLCISLLSAVHAVVATLRLQAMCFVLCYLHLCVLFVLCPVLVSSFTRIAIPRAIMSSACVPSYISFVHMPSCLQPACLQAHCDQHMKLILHHAGVWLGGGDAAEEVTGSCLLIVALPSGL